MHATVRSVIEVSGNAPDEVCLLDTEASPEHLSRGTTMYADLMLCVVEPYYKSLETGRRMAALGVDLGIPKVLLVGNKVRDDREREVIEQFAAKQELEIAAFIPFDSAMPDSERAESAPLDHAPDAAAVKAIGELAETVMALGTVRA